VCLSAHTTPHAVGAVFGGRRADGVSKYAIEVHPRLKPRQSPDPLCGQVRSFEHLSFYEFSFFTAAESAPTVWKPFDTATAPSGDVGGVYMASDRQHNLLYASAYDVGLFRHVTK
jgi:hypothetical protein